VGNDPTVYHYSFVIRADKDRDDDHGKKGDDQKSEAKKGDDKGKKK